MAKKATSSRGCREREAGRRALKVETGQTRKWTRTAIGRPGKTVFDELGGEAKILLGSERSRRGLRVHVQLKGADHEEAGADCRAGDEPAPLARTASRRREPPAGRTTTTSDVDTLSALEERGELGGCAVVISLDVVSRPHRPHVPRSRAEPDGVVRGELPGVRADGSEGWVSTTTTPKDQVKKLTAR